jgi:hypothetical protein
MPTAGTKDLVLQTGRVAYGKASDGHLYPFLVDSSGNALQGIAKTIQTELLAITLVAASTQQKSSVIDLTGTKRVTVFIDHARGATTAFGTQGTEYRIQVSEKAAGNDTWRTLAAPAAEATACLAIASSTAVAAGTTVVTITSGTSQAALGDVVFWANTASAGSSEWAKVVAISGTATFTVLDGLTNTQAAAHTIYTKGEMFVYTIDASALMRMRVIVNNNASGTTLAVYSRIAAITES